MGNLLGLWWSSTDVMETAPAVTAGVCSLPPPLSLSDIKPELLVYHEPGVEGVKFAWPDPVDTLVQWMMAEALLPGTGLGCKVVFIIHGFLSTVSASWMHDMKDAVQRAEAGPVTVVLVGWGGGADLWPWDYRTSAASVGVVGHWLAPYMSAIRHTYPDVYIHSIGHSLGAHALGIAGRESRAFDRISGLDPAGPSFEKLNQENRLRPSDARMVDVIHTDGYESGDVISWIDPINHFGTLIPLGTVDFYPNYGVARQPGTHKLDVTGSHKRAHELYTWSINQQGAFRTDRVLADTPEYDRPVKQDKPAGRVAEMGYYSNVTTHDNFYLATNGRPPWAPLDTV